MLTGWREVRDVCAFIDEARAIVVAGGLAIQEGSTVDEFIRWATARAHRVNPLGELKEEVAETREA